MVMFSTTTKFCLLQCLIIVALICLLEKEKEKECNCGRGSLIASKTVLWAGIAKSAIQHLFGLE